MVLFLYSDKNCEHQAIACIRSLTNTAPDDLKIVYYTVGFKSDFNFKNLHKIEYPLRPEYPRFHFYKAELALVTMNIFPDEYYFFTDTDVIFSKRIDFNKLKHNLEYPLASFGPHDYPFIFEQYGNNTTIYDETKLMKYLNVPARTQRYCWSCFFSFNPNCKDFLEEYTSICKNKYLLDRQKFYFPYADETAFNVCLWKRNATQNLGFVFVNTALLDVVKNVEENDIKETHNNRILDHLGADWEYIHDSNFVILYHGFKEKESMDTAVEYIIHSTSKK